MTHSRSGNSALLAFVATALVACAALAPPTESHHPTTMPITVTSVAGQTRTVTVAVPYDSTCSLFPRYASTYLETFRGGYIAEWNTQLGFLDSKATDPAQKKALKDRYLRPPTVAPTDAAPMGLQETNCLMVANAATEEGRLQARNELAADSAVP